MADPDDALRINATRNHPVNDPGADHRNTEVVARFTRGMINDYTHEFRTQFDIGNSSPLTRQDVEAIATFSTEEVERAVRDSLPASLRTDENIRTVVDRLRAGVGLVLAERVGGVARNRLHAVEDQLAAPLDDRRTAAFLWQIAQNRPPVAAARLQALGMDGEAAARTAQLLSTTDVRSALQRGQLPEALEPAAAAVRELAPDAVALLRSTRETFAESDPLRFGRLAWNEAKAMAEEGTFVREAAERAIHDHEADRSSDSLARFFGGLAGTAAFGSAGSAGAGATNVLLSHAEVLTQQAGVLARISSPAALEHATHERTTTAVAAGVGVVMGAAAGKIAEHAVHAGPVLPHLAGRAVEAGADALSHLAVELMRRH